MRSVSARWTSRETATSSAVSSRESAATATPSVSRRGAAGMTSSAVECAGRAGAGIEIEVRKVARRERGMTAYEVMLSESQERMLVIVKPEAVERVRAGFARWELHADAIGDVTDDGRV